MSVARVFHIDSRDHAVRALISQERLEEIFNLQMLAWQAAKDAHLRCEEIRAQLSIGVNIEKGQFRWSEHLGGVTDGTI